MKNSTRIKLIKALIKTYYEMELASHEGHKMNPETYACIQDEISKLMTQDEFDTWVDCNEFHGFCWSKIDQVKEDDAFTHNLERMKALEASARINLGDITEVKETWDAGTCSFLVYGTMFDLDPDTYENGRAPMVVRVTNGAIDLVDGV